MASASGDAVETLLRALPIRVALLTDARGAILLRAAGAPDAAGDDATLELQRMGATFAQTAEQASKAGLGKNMHTTAFYGARRAPPAQRRGRPLFLQSAAPTKAPHPCHSEMRPPALAPPADKAVVVHIAVAPLTLTLLAESDANVGLILDAVPQLSAAVEPLAFAATGRGTS